MSPGHGLKTWGGVVDLGLGRGERANYGSCSYDDDRVYFICRIYGNKHSVLPLPKTFNEPLTQVSKCGMGRGRYGSIGWLHTGRFVLHFASSFLYGVVCMLNIGVACNLARCTILW